MKNNLYDTEAAIGYYELFEWNRGIIVLESGKTDIGDSSARFLKVKAKNRSYITCNGGSVLKPGEIDRNIRILELEQAAKDQKKKSAKELLSPEKRSPGPALGRLGTGTSITSNEP